MPARIWKRKNTRLPGYDYSQPGAYFVTICTEHRQALFGEIVNGLMRLNGPGEMISEQWQALPTHFAGIELDSMIVMPDHLHGVVFIGTDPDVLELPKLGDVIGDFKGRTTSRYIRHVKTGEWPPFRDRVWQRRYNDRIVRDDAELEKIQDYIEANPYRWEQRLNGTDT